MLPDRWSVYAHSTPRGFHSRDLPPLFALADYAFVTIHSTVGTSSFAVGRGVISLRQVALHFTASACGAYIAGSLLHRFGLAISIKCSSATRTLFQGRDERSWGL
jgi:hypothetical protein